MSTSRSDYLKRIMKYCAQAERCTFDVVRKLKEWGMEEEAGPILARLYEEKFVDDARYARGYASDQWRFRQWGKNKIRHALFLKQIASGEIEKALDQVPQEEYVRMIGQELLKKWKDLGMQTGVATGQKVLAFARQRGYEDEFVFPWMEEKGLLKSDGSTTLTNQE